MGYSLGWIAAKGIHPREILKKLGLGPRSTDWELDDGFAAAGLRLPSGWYLVIILNEAGVPWSAEPYAALSTMGVVVRFLLEREPSASLAQGFHAGAKQWELWHDPEDGPAALQVSGTPPECFEAIRQKRLAAEPSDSPRTCGLDIIIDVCESLTGFRYDKLPEVTMPYVHLNIGPTDTL